MINRAVHKALEKYLAGADPDPGDFLFRSRKGGGLRSRSGHQLKEPVPNFVLMKWDSCTPLYLIYYNFCRVHERTSSMRLPGREP